MGRNHEVITEQFLLDENGELREPGWSRRMVQKYRRDMIKAPKWRIKEWDYYLVLSDQFGVAFTISDDGYIGLQSASLLLFGEKAWEHTETVLNAFPMGKLHLPQDSSEGITEYKDKRLHMRFSAGSGSRRIQCLFRNFHEGKNLKCDITLRQGMYCMMESGMSSIRRRISEPLTGGGVSGPMTIPGTGVPEMRILTAAALDSISDMGLEIRKRRLRMYSFIMEKCINWTM